MEENSTAAPTPGNATVEYTNVPIPTTTPIVPCPNCGYCPTCGRSNHAPIPYVQPLPNPWPYPWIVWNQSNTQESLEQPIQAFYAGRCC